MDLCGLQLIFLFQNPAFNTKASCYEYPSRGLNNSVGVCKEASVIMNPRVNQQREM